MKLATFDDDGWTLDDGEARHDQSPTTFQMPQLQERSNLAPGQIVKLLFRIALHNEQEEYFEEVERMWVVVKGRTGALYRGILDNDSHHTDEMKAGMEVVFEPRHVIQIYREE